MLRLLGVPWKGYLAGLPLTDRITFLSGDDIYAAAEHGECDALLGTAKDAVLYDGAFAVLRDSRAFFSASSLAPTLHVAPASEYPELEVILGGLSASLDATTLARMERLVATGEARADRVAEEFLQAAGLIEE